MSWPRDWHDVIFRVLALCEGNPPVAGVFPSQRPVTRSIGVFFDVRLNKRLSKQSGSRWFETSWCSIWRHYDDSNLIYRHSRTLARVATVTCWLYPNKFYLNLSYLNLLRSTAKTQLRVTFQIKLPLTVIHLFFMSIKHWSPVEYHVHIGHRYLLKIMKLCCDDNFLIWTQAAWVMGCWFNIRCCFTSTGILIWRNRTILRRSDIHNGIPYACKMVTSLYWIQCLIC